MKNLDSNFVAPIFPKKKWIGNLEESFLVRRKDELEKFMQNIASIEGLLKAKIFKDFIN